MPADFLHNHRDFPSLLRIVADERRVQPVLVEKDYWIMHCLYGLQRKAWRRSGLSLRLTRPM
jgi:hypothetical protein